MLAREHYSNRYNGTIVFDELLGKFRENVGNLNFVEQFKRSFIATRD